MTRAEQRAGFLAAVGWTGMDVRPLAGDASTRAYFRVAGSGRSAVLMDVAGETDGSLTRFLTVGAYLQNIGLHPPMVLAEDRVNGLLLLEDLGDDLFARVMANDPATEIPLYRSAIDLLAVVQRGDPPKLPAFDAATMATIAGLAAETYADRPQEAEALTLALRPMLEDIAPARPVMLLRDFHAENLIWCSDKSGHRRIGLLDFQDAVLGHPVYDIVSLLQDARRDVSANVEADLKSYARSQALWNDPGFERAYALLGAQRALRILGVFARLSLSHGKPGYIDLIPRVWAHLERNLGHPDLSSLATTVRGILPVPDDRLLNSLKARCKALPTP